MSNICRASSSKAAAVLSNRIPHPLSDWCISIYNKPNHTFPDKITMLIFQFYTILWRILPCFQSFPCSIFSQHLCYILIELHELFFLRQFSLVWFEFPISFTYQCITLCEHKDNRHCNLIRNEMSSIVMQVVPLPVSHSSKNFSSARSTMRWYWSIEMQYLFSKKLFSAYRKYCIVSLPYSMNAFLEESCLCSFGNEFLHLLKFLYAAGFEPS